MKNPAYEQNLERDAKLVAAAQRGQLTFFRVASEMGLWTTPMEAIKYARNLGLQPEGYRQEVGRIAATLIGLADGDQPPRRRPS